MSPSDPKEDDENPVWTRADFSRAVPASEVHGPDVARMLVKGPEEVQNPIKSALLKEGPGITRVEFSPYSLREAA